jgi:hypothetical protein
MGALLGEWGRAVRAAGRREDGARSLTQAPRLRRGGRSSGGRDTARGRIFSVDRAARAASPGDESDADLARDRWLGEDARTSRSPRRGREITISIEGSAPETLVAEAAHVERR